MALSYILKSTSHSSPARLTRKQSHKSCRCEWDKMADINGLRLIRLCGKRKLPEGAPGNSFRHYLIILAEVWVAHIFTCRGVSIQGLHSVYVYTVSSSGRQISRNTSRLYDCFLVTKQASILTVDIVQSVVEAGKWLNASMLVLAWSVIGRLMGCTSSLPLALIHAWVSPSHSWQVQQRPCHVLPCLW